jgi:hypothetical protein
MEVNTTASTTPDNTHRVAVHNGQSVWTCSDTHASNVFTNPTASAAAAPTTAVPSSDPANNTAPPFCVGSTVMFNGFTFTGNGVCVRFLFDGWDLDSAGKLAGAIIGTFLAAISLEALFYWRRRVKLQLNHISTPHSGSDNLFGELYVHLTHLYTQIVPKAAGAQQTGDNDKLEEGVHVSMFTATHSLAQLRTTTALRALSAVLLLTSLTISYFLMLIAMTYHGGLFISLIFGLFIGSLLFRRTRSQISRTDTKLPADQRASFDEQAAHECCRSE